MAECDDDVGKFRKWIITPCDKGINITSTDWESYSGT